MRAFLWLLLGSLVAGVSAAVLFACTLSPGPTEYFSDDFLIASGLALFVTIPSSLVGMLLLLILREFVRLNLALVAGGGALIGAIGGMMFRGPAVALFGGGIGCLACLIAYPAISRANSFRAK